MLEFCRKLEKTPFLFPNFSRAVVSYAAPQPSETINMWELQKKKKKRERDAWVLSEDSHLVCLDENLLSAFSQVSMILIHSWFTNNWDHFQFICFPLLHFQFPSFMIDLPISASSCHLGQWRFSHVPPQLPASGPPPGHDSCFLIFWFWPLFEHPSSRKG